jgi:hypothetical protein
MIDMLVGFVVGGLIASLAPMVTLIMDQKRWKRTSELEQLRIERERLERSFRYNLTDLFRAMRENSFSSEMISEFTLTMPKEVGVRFREFMTDPEKTDAKCRKAFMDIVGLMKKSLAEVDDRIDRLLS